MSYAGKHPRACTKCGGPTWRGAQVCRLCDPPAGRQPRILIHVRPEEYARRLPLELLEACAQEYLRRHGERAEALKRILGVAA